MSKNLKEKNSKTLVITYDHLFQRLSEINSILPIVEKVMPKLKENFRWTKENYNHISARTGLSESRGEPVKDVQTGLFCSKSDGYKIQVDI